jgi:hypothetical protein
MGVSLHRPALKGPVCTSGAVAPSGTGTPPGAAGTAAPSGGAPAAARIVLTSSSDIGSKSPIASCADFFAATVAAAALFAALFLIFAASSSQGHRYPTVRS